MWHSHERSQLSLSFFFSTNRCRILDADIRARLRGELRQLQKSLAQTVLYVTHDQAEALSMSDRIAIMRDGEIVQVGTPEEIYNHPVNRFVAEFIGDPPLNVIACEVRSDGSTTIISLPEGATLCVSNCGLGAGQHWLGVRPHDVELVDAGTAGAVPAPLRFLENCGARHVLHLEYGEDLLRVEARPGSRSIGDLFYLRFPVNSSFLIDRKDERVVFLRRIRGSGMSQVTVDRVQKIFGDVRALDDVSLSVNRGEFLCVVGRTNAGKSTLLKTIAGIHRPNVGRVIIAGNDVTPLPPQRRSVSLLFQNIALFPTKTGRENIAFPLRMAGEEVATIDAKVRAIAKMLKIEHVLDRLPRTFSGGEQQRVAIGRAIIRPCEF